MQKTGRSIIQFPITRQELIYGDDEAYLDRAVDAGFHGVYLDKIDPFEGYESLLGRVVCSKEGFVQH